MEFIDVTLKYWPIILGILGVILYLLSAYHKYETLKQRSEHHAADIALIKPILLELKESNNKNREIIDEYYLKWAFELDKAKVENENALLKHRAEVDKELSRLERKISDDLNKINGTVTTTQNDVNRLVKSVEDYIQLDRDHKELEAKSHLEFYKAYGGALNKMKNDFERGH